MDDLRGIRFRFHAINSLMQWQALNTGNVFVQRNSVFRTASVGEMNALLAQSRIPSKENMFFGISLRGTRSYRFKRCLELIDMVNQLGVPTAFMTLLAADLPCPTL